MQVYIFIFIWLRTEAVPTDRANLLAMSPLIILVGSQVLLENFTMSYKNVAYIRLIRDAESMHSKAILLKIQSNNPNYQAKRHCLPK